MSEHDTYAEHCRERVPGTPAHGGGRCEACDAIAVAAFADALELMRHTLWVCGQFGMRPSWNESDEFKAGWAAAMDHAAELNAGAIRDNETLELILMQQIARIEQRGIR